MQLKTVALITLLALIIHFIYIVFIGHSYLMKDPIGFVFKKIDDLALIFFFTMLYLNSGKKDA